MDILSEPILVGRTQELEQLQHYLELVTDGKGATVFVSGEAGAGKTKLITEFLKAAKQKKDLVVLSGWCLNGAGIPYFPFMEAFSAYFSSLEKREEISSEEAELNLWLKGPVKTGLSSDYSPEAWKELTFGAVRNALALVLAKKPAVLFIDDIQWADSASLALLYYLSRTLSSNKLLILATFRSEETRTQPLDSALHQMSRENLFKEIKLSGLSISEVGLLAENLMGGSVAPTLAQKLQNESQGNPLFVVESLRMLSEKNSLVQQRNKWCLSTEEVGIPTRIKDIVLSRVSRLTPENRRILDLASVIGSKFDPEILAQVLGIDSLKVLEALDSISRISSLVVIDGKQYRFDHAKSREALYDEISPALRKAYHSKIAEKLEASGNNTSSDLAYHYGGAENLEKAIKYSLAAGEESLKSLLGTEAIKQFNFVLDSTKDNPSFSAEREIATEGLADGLYANASSKSIPIYEQLYRETKSNLVKARALRKAGYATLMQGSYGHALDLVNTPFDNSDVDKLENAKFRYIKGTVEDWGGYSAIARLDLQEALNVFLEEYSILDIIETHAEMAINYIMERSKENSTRLGQLVKSLASALYAHALADSTKNVSKQVNANNILFIIYNKCGLLSEAIQTVEENSRLSQEIGDPTTRASTQAWTYWMSGYLAESRSVDRILSKLPIERMQSFGTTTKLKFFMSSIMSGTISNMKKDVNFAISESLKGLEFAEQADFFEIQAFNYENLTRQYAELGQLKQSEIYLNKMEKIFQESSLAGFIFANVTNLFTKAVYYQSKKEWEKANGFYEEAIAYYKKLSPGTGIMAGIQKGYCWTLLLQGRFEDAKQQFLEAKAITDELDNLLVHSNILPFVLAPANIEAGKQFEIRIDLINVAKKTGVLIGITDLIPSQFQVESIVPNIEIDNNIVNLQKELINPFKDKTITLKVKATEEGTVSINPTITYLDELGETKTSTPQPTKINVLPEKPSFEILPNRVSTGISEVNRIMLGGIPQQYAVVLSATSSDESETILEKFIETGAKRGEPTLCLTTVSLNASELAKTYTNLSVFCYNPQFEIGQSSFPNIFSLKNFDNLTDMDIRLTSYLRTLGPISSPRRACIQILSDVLLQHHVVVTRKWLAEFLASLKSKGFTTLAFIDPTMHPSEEAQAILGLFDGEIRISEKETPNGLEKMLKIRKLYNQKYQSKELLLTKEFLSES